MMKILDNRGFTLVELLAVVAILVVIMVIAIPNISSSIERSNDKKNSAMEKVLKSEAELYVSKHKASINASASNECYISVDSLVDEGYISFDDLDGYENGCLVYNGTSYVYYEFSDSKCGAVSNQCR